jgi:glycosyltransferase involved in cell wall biosynthesis
MAVGFFGSFYPSVQRAANSSTGIVLGLSRSPRIETVYAFVPAGSKIPEFLEEDKIRLVRCWSHDAPLSLIRAAIKMIQMRRWISAYLFNTYVTAFGRSKIANGLGLLVPVLVGLLTSRRVVVYMHNFVETQDVPRLGYRQTKFALLAARILEILLLFSTRVIVPLQSQKMALEEVTKSEVGVAFVPHLESFLSLLHSDPVEQNTDSGPREGSIRFLLFGSWGPGKDLEGILGALAELHDDGLRFRVTIAGGVNQSFPEYAAEFRLLIKRYGRMDLGLPGVVPDESLETLFRDHDVLILPYKAAGGYSGAMNAAAATGIRVLAYDLPQLRETANVLRLSPDFVNGMDKGTLVSTLRGMIQQEPVERRGESPNVSSRINETQEALENLFMEIDSTSVKDNAA